MAKELQEVPVLTMFGRFDDYLDFEKFERWNNNGPGIKASEIFYQLRRDMYLEMFRKFLRREGIIVKVDEDGNEHYLEKTE